MPRPALVRPELTILLSPASAAALLAAIDAPQTLRELAASPPAPADAPLDLARALFTTPLPPAALATLDLFSHLATPNARDAAVEAAHDIALDPRRWHRISTPDVALDLVLGSLRRDVPIERIVARVRIRLARLLPQRMGYEYVARDPRPVDPTTLARALDAIPSLDTPWIAEPEDDGVLHAALLWDETPDLCAVRTGRRVKRRFESIVRADVLRVDAAAGRFTITSPRPERTAMIAEAIARGVFGDARAFNERPVFTLRPLLTLGSKGLANAALPAPVTRVEVVACENFTSPDQRGSELGPTALDEIVAGVRAKGGYIGRATLRFTIDDVRAPVDVTIDLPKKIGMREPRHDSVVRAALATLGILSPGAAGDDMTTIVGVPIPEWRVCELAGKGGFRRLVDTGVLAAEDPKKSRGVANEAMRALGYTLRTFEIDHPDDAARQYAVAADTSVRARSVGESDRAMWRLDPARLCDRIRADAGLEQGPAVDLPRGVADVGVVVTTSGPLRVFYVMGAVLSDQEKGRVAQRIVKAARPAVALAFVPRGRKLGRDVAEVEIDVPEQLGLSSWRVHLERALADLGLARAKNAGAGTAGRLRLVLRGEADGRRLTVVLNDRVRALQPRLFAVLMRLVARHERDPEAWLSHQELGTATTPAVPTRLRESFDDLLPADMVMIENSRGEGYRLGAAVVVDPVAWGEFENHTHPIVRRTARENRRPGAGGTAADARRRGGQARESAASPAAATPRVRGWERSSS